MRQKITVLITSFFFLCANYSIAQFRDFQDLEVENIDITSIMYRTARVGVGFANYNAYNSIVGANPPCVRSPAYSNSVFVILEESTQTETT
ncbi:MAG: hypothetical protein OHK0019_22300 [Saprospiraceae bacterium]